jgi:hypothetical protein
MILDRETMEEEIRALARQCKCISRDGPCRFCLKADQLNHKLDKMQAEDDVVREIVEWLESPGTMTAYSDTKSVLRGLAGAIRRGDWRLKTEKPR